MLDNYPSMDATEVAQAKAYGAIILAHGNMAEWAFTNAISIGSGILGLAVHLSIHGPYIQACFFMHTTYAMGHINNRPACAYSAFLAYGRNSNCDAVTAAIRHCHNF